MSAEPHLETFSPCQILHSPIKAALFSNSIRISVLSSLQKVSPVAASWYGFIILPHIFPLSNVFLHAASAFIPSRIGRKNAAIITAKFLNRQKSLKFCPLFSFRKQGAKNTYFLFPPPEKGENRTAEKGSSIGRCLRIPMYKASFVRRLFPMQPNTQPKTPSHYKKTPGHFIILSRSFFRTSQQALLRLPNTCGYSLQNSCCIP